MKLIFSYPPGQGDPRPGSWNAPRWPEVGEDIASPENMFGLYYRVKSVNKVTRVVELEEREPTEAEQKDPRDA